MRYLIDTQILIWYQLNSPQLSDKSKKILLNPSNEIFVSQITLMEIVIKNKVGKLPELDISIEQLVKLIEYDDFEILEIKNEHIGKYSDIPLIPEHRDPFDRLILATAFHESIPLISADEKFKYYQELIHLVEN